MPLPGQRDPERTAATLCHWLAEQMPDARGIEVPWIEIPQSSGFSNETFLFDAHWERAGNVEDGKFVLRVQPARYALFPDIDILRQQYTPMKLLGEHTDIPVAKTRFAEPSTEVFGQPFFVMDRVEGEVPADNPPYTAAGFVIDLPPAERRALYEDGLETMTRIHRVDWRNCGLGVLDRARHGKPGSEQLRNFFRYYYDWALEGKPHRVADAAWSWLEANWPRDDEHLDLTWGDARMGNLMFRDGRCVAVFDWEMSALANAESDLGWWIYMQRFHTEGYGVPLPEGFLDRSEIIAFWEEKVGRRAEHVDFYEVLGGFHFTLIMVMMGRNLMEIVPDQADPAFGETNPGPLVLAKIMGI